MLSFVSPELEHKEAVERILALSDYSGCAYSFTNLFCWKDKYGTEVCISGDTLFIRSRMGGYAYPAGKVDIRDAINKLLADANERNNRFFMHSVTEEQKLDMESLFPDVFIFEEDRNSFDYIYSSKKMALLSGKKYHGKRNHISKFKRNYTWQCAEIDDGNIDICYEVADRWYSENDCLCSPDLRQESCALKKAMQNRKELGMRGMLLTVDGCGAAFTLGSVLNSNTFDVNFEKALKKYDGAYTMINYCFSNSLCDEFDFLNREEDLGDEGLRKSKLSYRPEILLKKYTAVLS